MKNLGIEVLSNGKLQTKDQALESSDFKTINSQSIVGSGDIAVSVTVDNSSITKNASDQIQAVALKNKSVDISSGTAVVSSNLNGVVTLTVSQYNTLKTNGTITVDGTTLTYDENGTIYNTVDESEVSIVAVDITLVSSETTSGTLTSTELQTLQANNQNYIRTKLTIDNTDHIEIYRLNTDASDDGTMQYVHSMYENNSGTTKYLTITTSTGSWVITEDSGGGSQLYEHNITFNIINQEVNITIINNSNTILTFSNIVNIFISRGYYMRATNENNAKYCYPVAKSPAIQNGDYTVWYGCKLNYNKNQIRVYGSKHTITAVIDPDTQLITLTNTASYVQTTLTSSVNIEDTVTPL